jgi:hypothetical protein
VATSAGAINGAFICTREQTVDTADELATIRRNVRRNQTFALHRFTGLLGFLRTRTYDSRGKESPCTSGSFLPPED